MWDSKTIAATIRQETKSLELEANYIYLKLFNEESHIGIGSDGKGKTILILPGQDNVLGFETEFANYDPWSNLVIFETDKKLNGVSILRCDIALDDTSTIEAASAIFLGLLDLQAQFGETGKAIWQMKSLFENGLKYDLSENIITGLFGELLIILTSDFPSTTVKHWHSDINDKFDFSGANFRLEVKTSSSIERNHHFSSFQIPSESPDKTFIASIMISKVEKGYNFQDLLLNLKVLLSFEDLKKVHEIILRTLGIPSEMVNNYEIDLSESTDSIRIYSSLDIPQPKLEENVISMEWFASLENVDANKYFKSSFLNENFFIPE